MARQAKFRSLGYGLVLLALTAVAVGVAGPALAQDEGAAPQANPLVRTVPGEVLVSYDARSVGTLSLDDAGAPDAEFGDFAVEETSVIAEDVGASDLILDVKLEDPADTQSYIDAMNELDGVSAQPNFIYRLEGIDALNTWDPGGEGLGILPNLLTSAEGAAPDDGAVSAATDATTAEVPDGPDAANSSAPTPSSPISVIADDAGAGNAISPALPSLAAPDAATGGSASPLASPSDSEEYYLGPFGGSSSGANVLAAWDLAKTQGRVTVAVIDSGCDADHSDLRDNLDTDHMLDLTDNTPAGQIRDHHTGGHGTHVCGLVAAKVDNVVGVAGTSYNARLLPVAVTNANGELTTDTAVKALTYLDGLIERGEVANLRVINMSWGGYGADGDERNDVLCQAITHLRDAHGVVSVCAGGNGDEYGQPITSESFPSDYNASLAVTSLTRSGGDSRWSDFNAKKDISCPGESIVSTVPGGYTGRKDGTSMASPQVAGIVSLLFTAVPDLTADQAVEAITATAHSLRGQANHAMRIGRTASAGAIDAAAAVRYAIDTYGSGAGQYRSIHRLNNAYTGEHLYTSDAHEATSLGQSMGWEREGIGWHAPYEGTAVYRLFNPYISDHLYTSDANEVRTLTAVGWRSDNGGEPVFHSGGSVPIYRLFNPANQRHHLTTDANEYEALSSMGWRQEGVKLYALGDGEAYEPPPETIPVESVDLEEDYVELEVGDDYAFTAQVLPPNATNQNVIWSVDDPDVLEISQDGVVTALAPGDTYVNVETEDGGYWDFCEVEVASEEVPVTGVSLWPDSLSLTLGSGMRIEAFVEPEDATNQDVYWESSDPDVAEVDEDGFVEAVDVGSATITVTTDDGGYTATCEVTVEADAEPDDIPVSGVSLSRDWLELDVGDEYRLTAEVEPEDATWQELAWTSDDSSVATVSPAGVVRAVGEGSTAITVMTLDGGYTASCEVTVRPTEPAEVPVTNVIVEPSTSTIGVGETVQLTATVLPANATNRGVSWSSWSPEVATVDQSGLVRGVGPGATAILATSDEGRFVGLAYVTVLGAEEPPEPDDGDFGGDISYDPSRTGDANVAMSQRVYTINRGEMLRVQATFTMPEPYRENSHAYVGYVARNDRGSWVELGSFWIDGGVAVADLWIPTQDLAPGSYAFTCSLFPGDHFVTGGTLHDELFTVVVR